MRLPRETRSTVRPHAPRCGQTGCLAGSLAALSRCETSVPLIPSPPKKKQSEPLTPSLGWGRGSGVWPPRSRWGLRGDRVRWARRHVLSATGFALRRRELPPSGGGRWLQVRGEGMQVPHRCQEAQAEQRGKAGATAGRPVSKTRYSALLTDASREVISVGVRRTRGMGTRSWDRCVHLSLT